MTRCTACGSATARAARSAHGRHVARLSRGGGARGNTAAQIWSSRDWKPGEPLWTGTIDGDAVAVQVRPVAERLCSRLSRRRDQGLCLHRDGGRATRG